MSEGLFHIRPLKIEVKNYYKTPTSWLELIVADINAVMKPFTDYEKKPASEGDAARKEELLDLINSAEKAKKALAKAVDDACKDIAKEVRAIHRKETRLLEKAGVIPVETEDEEEETEE